MLERGKASQVFMINPALAESYKALFHQLGKEKFFINFQEDETRELFKKTRYLHRAIEVIYRPQAERVSHNYQSSLSYQHDGVVHIDISHALRSFTPREVFSCKRAS